MGGDGFGVRGVVIISGFEFLEFRVLDWGFK